MPATQAELRLAESYRQTQLRVRASFVRDYLALWRTVSAADLAAGDTAEWLRLVIVLVGRYHAQSATAGQAYVTHARLLGVGEPPGVLPTLRDVPDDVVVRNLLATGPGAYRDAVRRGATPEQARDRALVASQGAASRLVLDGGRGVVDEHVRTDPVALGYMRVTDGDPCAFCAMLASRGAVYKSAASAGQRAASERWPDARGHVNRYHDDCGCTVAPVYSRDAALPDASQRFEKLWADATRGLSRDEARRAFRRAVEGRPVEGDPLYRG